MTLINCLKIGTDDTYMSKYRLKTNIVMINEKTNVLILVLDEFNNGSIFNI